MKTEAMRSGDAFSGVRITSPAFAADGTFRRDDSLLKAVATVSCTAEPGSCEVRFGPAVDVHISGIDRLWGVVRVAPADAAERAECARQVAARPPESMEERYPVGSGWPSGPWDVRSVEPGGEPSATSSSAVCARPERASVSPRTGSKRFCGRREAPLAACERGLPGRCA
ncbi:hypothetical protein ABT224_20895 [Streptomyces sp. NPDC001584]|uniref:hypothetical protein n=1 Tax=Streptomyces sp. NPDC001584 TaxID=3154521 RepID=UPI003332F8EE